MIIPPSRAVNEPCRIKLPHSVRETKFGVSCNYLTPAFVVYDLSRIEYQQIASWMMVFDLTYPCYDTGIALVLVYKNFELTIKLSLLIGIR
jgi:hypothetical protein